MSQMKVILGFDGGNVKGRNHYEDIGRR